ncbi:MAG TPA: HD domain-containing phosphohydrolase [Candidatus Limnocylindria bacterium]|nr:HD domain-containing phosphohydrolase [Candidatus Limnocylindria bacterium]
MTEKLTPQRRPIVLVVDDVAANRELLEGHLDELGYDVRQARDGVEALEAVSAEEPDLVLLDIDMPRLDGIAVCERLKAHPTRRLIPIVILTASNDRNTRLRGITAGADDYLSKPFDANELLVRTKVLLRERALNRRLDATEGVLFALARAVEARDRYTIHHAERVGRYSQAMGGALGMDAEDCELLYEGGVLHDLGKIAIPDAILLKPGPLNDHEFARMREHSVEGERICLSLRSVAQYLPIIRHHHERVDGAGYPDHLMGSEIPLGARIAAVSDGWDAMVSDRPYRPGLDHEEALRRLRANAGTQWDAELVHLFLDLLDRGLTDRVVGAQLAAPA